MKDYIDIVRKFYLSSSPVFLIQYVTAICNLRCKMCFYMEQILNAHKRKELSTDDFRKIAVNLPNLVQVSIGGGEPLIRDDLAEILEIFTRISGVRYFTLPTNGTFPEKTERFLHDVLPRIQPTHLRMSLSLDGIGEEHDHIRGVKGTYDKFCETYRRISPLRNKYSNFSLDIVSTCSALNHDKIENLYNHAREKFDPDNFGLLYVRGNTDPEVKKVFLDFYRTTYERIDKDNREKRENRKNSSIFRAISSEVHDVIYETMQNDRFVIPCEAGRKMLVITEEGEVKPCEILSESYGKLQDYDFDLAALLRQHRVKEHVKNIKTSQCHCTFECAYSLNVLYHRKRNILSKAFRPNLVRSHNSSPFSDGRPQNRGSVS